MKINVYLECKLGTNNKWGDKTMENWNNMANMFTFRVRSVQKSSGDGAELNEFCCGMHVHTC